MPRTKLDKFSRPKTDPLKGLILAAGRDQHKSQSEMAKLAGVSPATYSRMLDKHSVKWSLESILSLCDGLRIPIEEIRPAVRYRY